MAENEEKKGTVQCPVCGSNIAIRKSPDGKKEVGVYCVNFKWENGMNVGTCDFQIFFNQDKTRFGRDLTKQDIKILLDGRVVMSPAGNKMTLDSQKESGYFTKIEYAPKGEDALL